VAADRRDKAPAGLRDVGSLQLTHLVTAAQNAWSGLGWAGTDLAVLAACVVAAGIPALWLFRWD
jgi:hypothetical protein